MSPQRGPTELTVPEEELCLVAELRARRPAAFAVLVRKHGGALLSTTRRLLRSEEDARDAVQDALLSAFRNIESFQGEARLSTWLQRIAINAALMKLRSRQRKPEQSIEELLPTFADDGHTTHAAAEWRSAEDTLVRRQLLESVQRCIDQLPESYRTVLILRDIEELDAEPAAQLLGMTTGALKVRLHRARLALRELLDPHLREGGKP